MSDADHDAPPSTGRTAAPLAMRAARSVADAKAGEVIMLGRRGEVLGPREVRRLKVRGWAFLGAMVGTLSVAYGVLLSPLAGVAAAVGTAALIGFRLRHWPQVRAGVALATTERWEEAQALLRALEARRLPRPFKSQVVVTLSALDALLGQPQAALDRLDAQLSWMRRSSYAYARVHRWRGEILRASLLARLGRLGEARRQRDAVRADIAARTARRTPGARGEFFEMLLQGTDLEIAFEADAPDELPDSDTLHEWARAALQRTRFGTMLVYLAWAFHRRGDEEMARHLLVEAPPRIVRSPLATSAPRLHAWAEERRAAWDLGAGAPA
jgi:hypothetical protein